MRRALRSGSQLGVVTVGLTVVTTIILLVLHQSQSVVFETAYTVNVICYAVAAYRAVRQTGQAGLATLDALVAATWAGALGTILQAALLGTLNGAVWLAVLVMLLIEWVTAIIVAPLCGWTGYLSRALWPPRGASAALPAQKQHQDHPLAPAVEGENGAA